MSAKNPFKKQRLEERILFELNRVLRTETSDSRLSNVTITKVDVNRDYSQAEVYWDTFDSSKRGDAKEAIGNMAKRLRHILARTLEMRKVPNLVFKYDAQFEAEKYIIDILNAEKNKSEK
ncbi:MAG: 30S ribosome-binding factor RbfA [Deltaproteobacteria bacterium]|nr:MAG: 30S ribosome-binding factor RbfA [Deltaproteobacteria bacterium]